MRVCVSVGLCLNSETSEWLSKYYTKQVKFDQVLSICYQYLFIYLLFDLDEIELYFIN